MGVSPGDAGRLSARTRVRDWGKHTNESGFPQLGKNGCGFCRGVWYIRNRHPVATYGDEEGSLAMRLMAGKGSFVIPADGDSRSGANSRYER
jgi:hypothetical protein